MIAPAPELGSVDIVNFKSAPELVDVERLVSEIILALTADKFLLKVTWLFVSVLPPIDNLILALSQVKFALSTKTPPVPIKGTLPAVKLVVKAPCTLAVPLTSKLNPASVDVPSSNLPHHLPNVVEELPITVVLLPNPIAECPITSWFVSLSALALVLNPIKIELLAIVRFEPVDNNLPASLPKATLFDPVV
jgi:hypothetical protein